MDVACWCGCLWSTPYVEGLCPVCGRHAILPSFRRQRDEAAMRADLDQLFAWQGVLSENDE